MRQAVTSGNVADIAAAKKYYRDARRLVRAASAAEFNRLYGVSVWDFADAASSANALWAALKNSDSTVVENARNNFTDARRQLGASIDAFTLHQAGFCEG